MGGLHLRLPRLCSYQDRQASEGEGYHHQDDGRCQEQDPAQRHQGAGGRQGKHPRFHRNQEGQACIENRRN